MRIRYIALMATLAASLLSAPTATACSLNPTAVISAPAASSSHIHGTGVSFVGTSSTANCGWISAYIWKNGVTVLSYSSSFSYNVTLEPEQVDSVITVSLQVINSYGHSHTVYRTITIKRDHQSQYFVKDHLGSPRVVVDGKGAVLSHTDYYPFGMVMPGRAGNISLANDRTKFTGYLLEEEGEQDSYHAEARGYDPVIGRFTSRDPITQVPNPRDLFKIHSGKHLWYSTYAYSFNNPVAFIDPDGKSPLKFFVKSVKGTWREVSRSHAVRKQASRQSTLTTGSGSSQASRKIMHEAHPDLKSKITRNDGEKEGYMPHHQHRNGSDKTGHAFYELGARGIGFLLYLVADTFTTGEIGDSTTEFKPIYTPQEPKEEPVKPVVPALVKPIRNETPKPEEDKDE